MANEEPFVSLIDLIREQQRATDELNAEIEKLRKLINQTVELNNGQVSQVETWEIIEMLRNWANHDNGD